MDKITFEIPGEPTAKGRPRFSRQGPYVRTFTPEKTANYENLVKLEYERQSGGAYFGETNLDVQIVACFGIPKSTSKKKREAMLRGAICPAKKPDCDNVLKIVCDALNGVAYADDKQIVKAGVVKMYLDVPKVVVSISEACLDVVV